MAKNEAIEFTVPTAVVTLTGFSEFAEKDRRLRKNRKTIVDAYFEEFKEGLRAKSTHAVYLGNRAGIGNMLKDRLKVEGFSPICSPIKNPKWIAVELGA